MGDTAARATVPGRAAEGCAWQGRQGRQLAPLERPACLTSWWPAARSAAYTEPYGFNMVLMDRGVAGGGQCAGFFGPCIARGGQ